MKEFRIGLAGRIIGISAMYDEVYEMCEDYLVKNKKNTEGVDVATEDFHVTVTQEDIDFEREKSDREAEAKGEEPEDYPESYLETLAVYRKIATAMLDYDTWLMHGAVVGINGEGVMFTAVSGVGKTTHLRLWLDNIPGAYVLNGDKPLLKWQEDVCMVCGTPWAGKEGMQRNEIVPLRAICFLERGTKNKIEKISLAEAYPLLVQQTYRSSDSAVMKKTLSQLGKLCTSVPMYRLVCNMDAEAAIVAYEGIYERKL